MTEMLDVVPTVIGGAVALKFLDAALPDKGGKSKKKGRIDMKKKTHNVKRKKGFSNYLPKTPSIHDMATHRKPSRLAIRTPSKRHRSMSVLKSAGM